MKKTYHIVTRAARESAAVVEQFCQSNGQILLPIVNLIQTASEVVEPNLLAEVRHWRIWPPSKTNVLEAILLDEVQGRFRIAFSRSKVE